MDHITAAPTEGATISDVEVELPTPQPSQHRVACRTEQAAPQARRAGAVLAILRERDLERLEHMLTHGRIGTHPVARPQRRHDLVVASYGGACLLIAE